MLIAELTEAFSKNTWAHRHETRGPEMTAWRRAAAFLDGAVFCGCPPRETGQSPSHGALSRPGSGKHQNSRRRVVVSSLACRNEDRAR